MAFLNIPNVEIKGISACVPTQIDENLNSNFADSDMTKLVTSIGVERKHIANDNICTSDLCFKAADKLVNDLTWDRSEIGALIFVTQTPDYVLPATSCILQERLGLGEECYTLDISLGCSGYVYAMSVLSALMSTGAIKKALLLAGDVLSKITSKEDKSAWPLFGDAGTATALESVPNAKGFQFHLASDGHGKDAIIIKDGGARNSISESSFIMKAYGDGIARTDLDLVLDGMNVFSFAISKAPQSVNKLLEHFSIDKETIDYFLFHQANLFLNEKIRKKLNLESEKVPYSLKNYGNTSSASIPLTMVTELKNELTSRKIEHIACGFGVGLSWATMNFSTNRVLCPELILY